MNKLAWWITISQERRSLDKCAAPPPQPSATCAAISVDDDIDGDDIESLGSRFLVVINDLDPSLGPRALSEGLTALLCKATWIAIETEERDEVFYRQFCIGAELGGRVILVSTEQSNERAWLKYRDRLLGHAPE